MLDPRCGRVCLCVCFCVNKAERVCVPDSQYLQVRSPCGVRVQGSWAGSAAWATGGHCHGALTGETRRRIFT